MEIEQACRVVAEEIMGSKTTNVHYDRSAYVWNGEFRMEKEALDYLLTGNGADELFQQLQKDGYQIIISTSEQGVAVRLQKGKEKAVSAMATNWKEAINYAAAKLMENQT